ncbi:hypothetical protein G6F42_016717 [Rhizopus arrhizus]|nr:hypothetical protein G6F42_016717 [Rhizopus arrhizus]
MSDVTDLSWVEVLSRGLSRKAINAQSQRAKDLTAKGLTRKATAILQQALTPGPVLSTFPNKTFGHRTVAYRVIQEQFSVNVQFRPLSLYHQKPNGGFLAEAKFDKIEDTKRAIHTGIIYKEVVYKTTAVKDSSEGKLTHTQMIMIRIPNMHTFLEDLLRSLKYSGKVYQANKYKVDGFFEYHASFMIDTTASCTIREEVQPLSRLFSSLPGMSMCQLPTVVHHRHVASVVRVATSKQHAPFLPSASVSNATNALQDDEASKTIHREVNYNTDHIDDKVNEKVPNAAPTIQDILEQQTQLKAATAAAAAATASTSDTKPPRTWNWIPKALIRSSQGSLSSKYAPSAISLCMPVYHSVLV